MTANKAFSTLEMAAAAQFGDYFMVVGGHNDMLGWKARKGRTGIMWTLGPKAGELVQLSKEVLALTWVRD